MSQNEAIYLTESYSIDRHDSRWDACDNGGPLKETNQFYNKRLTHLKSQLPYQDVDLQSAVSGH